MAINAADSGGAKAGLREEGKREVSLRSGVALTDVDVEQRHLLMRVENRIAERATVGALAGILVPTHQGHAHLRLRDLIQTLRLIAS